MPINYAFHEEQRSLASKWPYYGNGILNNCLFYGEDIPVRNGSSGFSEGIDLAALRYRLIPAFPISKHYWRPDERLREHMKVMARKNAKLNPDLGNPHFDDFPVRYDEFFRRREVNDTVRVSLFTESEMVLERATYLDQFGTNMACSEPVDLLDKKTLIDADTDLTGRLKQFSECLQVNSLGVAALVVDRDNIPLIRVRDRDRTSTMSGWHCFSSGVLTWQDLARSESAWATLSSADVANGFERGLRRELEKETGFVRRHIKMQIALYRFARELKRGGKPQLFYLVRFPEHGAYEIVRLMSKLEPSEIEYRDSIKRTGRHTVVGIARAVKEDASIGICPSLRIDQLTPAKLAAFAELMFGSVPSITRELFASLFYAIGLFPHLRWRDV